MRRRSGWRSPGGGRSPWRGCPRGLPVFSRRRGRGGPSGWPWRRRPGKIEEFFLPRWYHEPIHGQLAGGMHVRTRDTGTSDRSRDRGPALRGGEAFADWKRPWGRDPQLQEGDEGEERDRRHSPQAGEQGQVEGPVLPAGETRQRRRRPYSPFRVSTRYSSIPSGGSKNTTMKETDCPGKMSTLLSLFPKRFAMAVSICSRSAEFRSGMMFPAYAVFSAIVRLLLSSSSARTRIPLIFSGPWEVTIPLTTNRIPALPPVP